MKSLLSFAIVIVFIFGCFSCAPSYDSAQWAGKVKHKKHDNTCASTYKKPKKKKMR